jgi:hypothetical protein
MIRLPRHSWIWLATLLCWLAFLWFLSSRPGSGKIYPVDHIDKVLHFSYFCVGGFLCAHWWADSTSGIKPKLRSALAMMRAICSQISQGPWWVLICSDPCIASSASSLETASEQTKPDFCFAWEGIAINCLS